MGVLLASLTEELESFSIAHHVPACPQGICALGLPHKAHSIVSSPRGQVLPIPPGCRIMFNVTQVVSG